MSALSANLPQGRRGQWVALALLALVAGLLWLLVAAPLLDRYAEGKRQLAARRALLEHMTQLTESLPALRDAAASRPADAPPDAALLAGQSDAIAGAALQSAVQDMATAAGATIASAEALPAEQEGGFRRISLRVSLSGDWAVLMAMLRAVDQSKLRLLVDDLQLHAVVQLRNSRGPSVIEASFVVLGFRPGREGAAAPSVPPAAVADSAAVPINLRADFGTR